jgi:protein ImuB
MMERNGNAPADDMPMVLTVEGTHGPVIYAANRTARTVGVQTGARVVDMRAICPELQTDYANQAGDKAALERLVLWARRWCPWTASDGADGLILDTTGSAHLFGGENAMLIEMETQFSLLGLTSRLAIAPTRGTAWALARFGPVRSICAKGEIAQKLTPLPINGLRLNAETVLLLQRLGLKKIGALMNVPRLSLTRRFVKAALTANPMMRLDQALGKLAEPVASVDAKPRFSMQSRLPEPILDPAPYLPQLCDNLCDALQKAGMGCRCLHLTVYRTDGDVSHIDVATAASTRDPVHLHSLFRDKLERINPGFGFDLITLTAGSIEVLQTVQTQLDGEAHSELQLTQLLDRLTTKFGTRAVSCPVAYESHIPERAQGRIRNFASPPTHTAALIKQRPLKLLDTPEEVSVLYAVPEGPPAQFIWRRQTHRVTRYSGPERIAPEWWKDQPGTRLRDYFKIEDQTGRRIWLYREGLHEDGRGGDPRWFIHGMFA